MKSEGFFPVLVLMIFAFTLVSFSVTAVNFAGYLIERAPAVVSITTITNSGCAACENLATAVSSVKGAKTRVNSEKTLSLGSAEAAALIQKYSIQKLPALVVEGQTSKLSLSGFTAKEGALVYETATVPYSETSGNVRGILNVTYISAPSCNECYTLDVYKQMVDNSDFYIETEKTVSSETSEGLNLMDSLGITKAPAVLFEGDLGLYNLQSNMIGINAFLYSAPPYMDVPTKKVRGLVNITYLNDSACLDCYDVTLQKGIIQYYTEIYFSEENSVDVNSTEGKALIAKYNITAVPTVLLSGDLLVYTGLEEFWAGYLGGLGTVESDGTYVFRAMSLLGELKYVELD